MINYIKDAVTAVSGIKSFLFNTDYRNNFDLQNVEFPCCVLTPIMRTNYDLNNIIRESAELQLSVVESAPYDYSGDDLYAINKRCSDLALQVIANLQVKSKLDKELTFEFILPSGDELISGVMCNLQCTMRQGSCNGAPSYVEVVVQSIKRENITSNGKHIITPSSGFNAMREVEVDVNVVLKSNLQDKQVTITENGTQTITADEGYEGLNSVEVNSEVYEGIDLRFSGYSQERQDKYNGVLKKIINDSISVNDAYIPMTGNSLQNKFLKSPCAFFYNPYIVNDIDKASNLSSLFAGSEIKIVDFAFSNATNISSMLSNCVIYELNDLFFPKVTNALSLFTTGAIYDDSIKITFGDNNVNCGNIFNQTKFRKPCKITIQGGNVTNLTSFLFTTAGVIEEIEILADTSKCKTFTNFIYNTQVHSVKMGSIESMENSTDPFKALSRLEEIFFTRWKAQNLSFSDSLNISPESIKYIIWHALNGENVLGFENQGATSRTLKIHATPYNSWETWKLTKPSVEDCEYLGIDETEITKYGELTWEDIALSIKLITIAK